MISIAKLQSLRESEDHVEFKEAKHNYPFAGGKHSEPKDRRRCVLGYIVALANEGGGMLVLGMADHIPHQVVGSDFALNETGKLVDEIYTRLSIRVQAEELYENKRRVVVITIPSRPIGRLLKFEGVPLMRTGESLREMSDSEIFKVLSEQEPDFSANICSGLTLGDLDETAIKIMREKYATKQENPSFLTITTEQILSDLELLQPKGLTYAALILLGKKEAIKKYLPQNNIVIEYRINHSMIEYTARKEFQEPLYVAIDHVWEYINQPASNPQLHVNDGPYIYDIPSFNEEVIREAVLNAVSHRSMQIKSDIVIKQYPDSITITNAGGFPIGVDINNILTVNSTPRSKRLSEVLQKTGLVERSGQGVDKIYYHCMMEGKYIPDYSKTDYYQVNLRLQAKIQDKGFLFFVRREQNKRSDDNKLNVFDLYTLYKVSKRDYDDLDMAIIKKLEADHLVITEQGYYRLSDEYKNPMNELIKGFKIEDLKIIYDCFQTNTILSRKILDEAFDGILTTRQVRYLISKLEKNGLIVSDGERRYTKYKASDLLRELF